MTTVESRLMQCLSELCGIFYEDTKEMVRVQGIRRKEEIMREQKDPAKKLRKTQTKTAGRMLAALRGDVGASNLPDIFSSYADTAYEVQKEDKLADLTQYFTEEELNYMRILR